MFKVLSTLLSVSLLCSCAINTNVGEYVLGDVETSVRGHNVEVFTDRQLVSYRATFLGQVSSYYCQLESDMHLPQAGPFDDIDGSRNQLQDTLKSKVQQRGGNAIVYGQCYISAHADTDCQKALSCEGFAYQVEY